MRPRPLGLLDLVPFLLEPGGPVFLVKGRDPLTQPRLLVLQALEIGGRFPGGDDRCDGRQRAEVLDEVGADVARFFFLMRKSDAHLEFDLDLAKKTSNRIANDRQGRLPYKAVHSLV